MVETPRARNGSWSRDAQTSHRAAKRDDVYHADEAVRGWGDTKGAERILDRMAQAKPPVRPNEVTYNTLMVLYASKRSVRKCEALLTGAVKAGVKISQR